MQTINGKFLEVPMNMNPWFLEGMAQFETDRIRRDLKQIRLEEEAMQARRAEEKTIKARLYRPGLLMQIVPIFVEWMFSRGRKIHEYSSEKQVQASSKCG
jgi:hypothetical protein